MPAIANRFDRYVGKQVRRARDRNRLSPEALGKMLGISGRDIERYERGEKRIVASTLLSFSDALDVPVAFFFAGIGPARGRSVQADDRAIAAPAESRDLVRAFLHVKDPTLRQSLMMMVRRCADEV